MTISKVIFAGKFARNTPCLVLEFIQSSIVEKMTLSIVIFAGEIIENPPTSGVVILQYFDVNYYSLLP